MIINETIDSVIELFSQPGVEKNTLFNLPCTSFPKYHEKWKIASLEDNFPGGRYELCIESAFSESNFSELQKLGESKPGIYIIYARPLEGISYNALPLRRIFCRPRPFCSL